jgi:hypothetical protein
MDAILAQCDVSGSFTCNGCQKKFPHRFPVDEGRHQMPTHIVCPSCNRSAATDLDDVKRQYMFGVAQHLAESKILAKAKSAASAAQLLCSWFTATCLRRGIQWPRPTAQESNGHSAADPFREVLAYLVESIDRKGNAHAKLLNQLTRTYRQHSPRPVHGLAG